MSYIKTCSCTACRQGKHSKASKAMLKRKARGNRRLVSLACKLQNDEIIPAFVAGGYTD